MRSIVVSIGSVLLPAAASAHPDHRAAADLGFVHYLTDPFHIATALLAIAAVAGAFVAWRVRQRDSLVARRIR